MQIEAIVKRLLGLALAAAWWAWPVEAGEPVVSNVRATQRVGRLAVEISYDVAAADGDKLEVNVAVSEDGGQTYAELANGVTGDVGRGVAAGTNKRVVWEPDEAWLGRSLSQLRFRVSTTGCRPVAGMVWIPPGRFTMGSPPKEADRREDEGPQTEVTLTKGFWLGKHEVTQREWLEVMGSNPSHFKGGPDLPVDTVSWDEATGYCKKLTERERVAKRLPEGYEYCLPTEAQWEYACRAGTKSATAYGERLSSSQANFDGRYPYNGGAKGPYLGKTAKVGSYAPNGWGLYDMHGNVREWCLDRYEHELPGGSVSDPRGPWSGSYRVRRGGSWIFNGRNCRSAYRLRDVPGYQSDDLGFRLALVPVP
jgi:formylglycine-generating enzyme required for sulfatase activity